MRNPITGRCASLEYIAGQIALAGAALRAEKLTGRDRPRPLRSGMPDTVRTKADIWEAQLGADTELLRDQARIANNISRVQTSEQLAALDRVLRWLLWLPSEARQVVMGRAMGVPRAKLARKLRIDRSTAWRWEQEALHTIAARLRNKL